MGLKKGFRVLTLLIVLGCLMVSLGCLRRSPEQARPGQKAPAKEVAVETYLPLKQGNFWDYRGEGNEYAEYDDRVLFREGNLVQLKRANPGTTLAVIYEVKEDSITKVYTEEEFYEERNILASFKENQREIILKRPFTLGTTWTVGERTYEIIETNATVNTPAGSFKDCIKIRSTFKDSDHQIFQFYAPEVGMVKSEFRAGEALVVSDLKEYKLQ
ncbi:MAG: hypothetical protein ACOY9Y_04355 [Bacillota bacterium]